MRKGWSHDCDERDRMENFLCCVFLKILIEHINEHEKVDSTPGSAVNVIVMSDISQHFAYPTLASVYSSVDICNDNRHCLLKC